MIKPSWEWDLEGYVAASGCEINGGEFGLKMFVKTDHGLSEEEKNVLHRSQESIQSAVMRQSLRLKPETYDYAVKERAEILALFSCPIYVEEIPNGYCSSYCCAFKPWFIVTTRIGRIKIGWRKSVIHLEWTDSAITRTAAEIFPNEEAWPGYKTTQYDRVIHAHGYNAARKYIDRLMEA